MQLSRQQLAWLSTRGGRTPKDVIIHEDALSVIMSDENKKEVFVKIPEIFRYTIYQSRVKTL